MATRYWVDKNGTELFSDANAWGSASGTEDSAGVPGTTDAVVFDGVNGPSNHANNRCRVDQNVSVASIMAQAGYTGHLDASQDNVDISASGDVILDCSAWSLGNGTWTIDGDLDFADVTTITRGSSTVKMTGSAKTLSYKGNSSLYRLEIASGATITLTTQSATHVSANTYGGLVVDGLLTIDLGKRLFSRSGELIVGSSGKISGHYLNVLEVNKYNDGSKFQNNGEISTSYLYCDQPKNEAGFYLGVVSSGTSSRCYASTSDCSCKLLSGTINGSFSIRSDAASAFHVDIESVQMLGNLQITVSTGDQLVVSTVSNTEVQGHVTVTNEGSCNWSGAITLSGSANQTVSLDDIAFQPSLVVDKESGTLTFAGGHSAASFTATRGTLDFNGQTFVYTGNHTIASGVSIVSDNDAMNDATFEIGGNLSWSGSEGQPLVCRWTDAWSIEVDDTATLEHVDLQTTAQTDMTLRVTGTATAVDTRVEHSNASGGQPIIAHQQCTDQGNNTNWSFNAPPLCVKAARQTEPWQAIGQFFGGMQNG